MNRLTPEERRRWIAWQALAFRVPSSAVEALLPRL